MPESIAVPADVAEQARQALAERARNEGIEGASRQAVVCALELAQSPFVGQDTLELIGAWHAANPHATTPDGRCTRLAGLYGGAAAKRWALEQSALPTTSWLTEESATLEAMTAAPTSQGGMVALYPDSPEALVVPGGDPAEELHVTLAFVAEDAAGLLPADVAAIEAAAQAGAAVRSEPLLLSVIGAGTLGDSEPPATVLFLQQNDGDGTDHQDGVAAVANAVRAELNDYGSEGFPAEHDGFIPHLTVGYGTPLADAQRLIGSQAKFSSGPVVKLGDIRRAHEWAGGAQLAAARTPAAADRLARLNAVSKQARRRLMERTHAAAQVAIRDALRRAGVKIVQRASRRSTAAKAAVAAAHGRYGPGVLAAVGLSEQDVLRQVYDTLGDRYEEWAQESNEQQLREVAAILGVPAADVLRRLGPRLSAVASDSRTRLVDDLTSWTHRLLEDPEPSFGDIGEVPKDPTLPLSVIGAALLLATGMALSDEGRPQGESVVIEAWLTTSEEPAPVETVTWVHGDTSRPFEPHEALDGTTATWGDYDEAFASDGGFPSGIVSYYPGDHLGCSCLLESSFEAGDAGSGDAAAEAGAE